MCNIIIIILCKTLLTLFYLLMISTDCWKYRHISVSVETNSQGTDQEMAEHIRETGDGGVDRCLNHLNVKNLILQSIYAIVDKFVR